MARQGLAWLGVDWQGKGTSVHGGGSANRQGAAGPGKARHGMARLGAVRQGCFGTWWRFRKSSGYGVARLDSAWLGRDWRGKGFYFQTLTGGLNYDFSGRHDKAKAG